MLLGECNVPVTNGNFDKLIEVEYGLARELKTPGPQSYRPPTVTWDLHQENKVIMVKI